MYKSLVLAVSALAGLAFAQSIPTCAQSCISLPTQCNNDPKCICSDTQWISDISCCIFKACNTADQTAALAYAQGICTPVGATLPASASCNNGTTTATSSASATGTTASSGTTAAASASSGSNSTTTHTSAASSASSASASASIATSRAFAGQLVIPQAGGVIGAILGAAALL